MKIRSITLENVRRFTNPVTVGPIGDGVTLLCEPNEAGKSTLFDAVHALFFQPHRSAKAEVKALQPHSKGKVAVECELDHAGASWRIRKEWLSGSSARIWRDGTLIHQDDAAEDWLATLVSGVAGGPGGLLWVRQGRVSLSVDGKYRKADEKGEDHEGRRSLLTAVSGAMDEVTGGERMDRARERVAAELGRLQTGTGKPKTGGLWAEAQQELAALEAEESGLSGVVEALHDDLEARRAKKGRLADLERAEDVEKRRSDLAESEKALREAEGLARDLAAARTQEQLARQDAHNQRDTAERADLARREAETAASERDEASRNRDEARSKAQAAGEAHASAKVRLDAARGARRQAAEVLRRVERAKAVAGAASERARLADQIAKAEAAEAERIENTALADGGPDEKTVARIDALARSLEARRTARDAAAPKVSVRYTEGATRVVITGTTLEDGETRALPPDGRVQIPGVGDLTISGTGDDVADAFEAADQALCDALAEGGWPDLAALHEAARARATAERVATLATERRDTLAPDGIDVLKQAFAALGETGDADIAGLPESGEAEAVHEAAAIAETEAEADERRASQIAQGAAVALAKAEEVLKGALRRLERAEWDLSALPLEDPHQRAARLAELDRVAREAAERVAHLAEKTPDLDALRAQRDRRKRVMENANEEIARLKVEIGTLDGRIDTRLIEGAEETLADVRGHLSAAREALARVEFEVEVLRRLQAALDGAQKAAHETYFRPIVEELRPLLADLWDDAELTWAGDTLLPDKLVRRGTEEDIDVLSGGTQEQIAFLVRLAFARLLAKAGRPTPLILDDALVYSDDDRIEKMFDALHRAAGDLQIIVLSCRQRAFSNLGAPSLSFRAVEAA